MKEFFKKNVRRTASVFKRGLSPEMEVIYQNIFKRDLDKIGLEDNYYAIGGAANYSLLYLILRICTQLKVANVLELGAGQSSILLSNLALKGLLTANINTIEHDPDWVNNIQSQVSHNVICCNLVEKRDIAGSYMGYDFGDRTPKTIDFLLIDGPPAYEPSIALSRHGALSLLNNLDQTGFVIIIDDAERSGENLLTQRIAAALNTKNVIYRQSTVTAAKKQIVFAAGRLLQASYF